MYKLIAQNKRRSWLLMLFFIAVIVGLGWLINQFTEYGSGLVLAALIFALFSVLLTYYSGDKMVLASVGAKQIKKEDDPELFRIVENLAITSGLPMPKVYIIPDPALNAFATGRDPEHGSVAITAGLRRLLNKTELEAVMAHEMSHIKHYDIRLMLITAVLVGMVIFIADILWRVALNGDSRKNSAILVIPAVIIGLIGAPIAAQLIKFAISRRRELLADGGSVMLTRYPEAMISALQKIAQRPNLKGHNEAIAHLFISSPLKGKKFMAKLFSTHPPLQERIEAIREAARIRT